jgi:hypothetical protein
MMSNTNPVYSNQNVAKASFWIIYLNSIIESFLLFFDDRFSIITFQLILNLSFVGYIFLKKFRIRVSNVSIPALLLIFQFIIISIFSSDIWLSINMLFKFSFPFLFLIIGYSLNKNGLLFYLLNKVWFFSAYFTVYIVIVNYFDIGNEIYKDGLKTGFYTINGLYIPIFSTIFALFFFDNLKDSKIKILTSIFSIFTIVITIALLKRTLILLLVIALFLYLLNSLNLKKALRITLVSVIATSVFYTFFFNDFQNTLQSRENRFNDEYSFFSEGRLTENLVVYELMKNEPIKLIFGYGEVFNDREYLSYTIYGEREIHNSFARVFWNGGVLGLFLFSFFYLAQLKVMITGFSNTKRWDSSFRSIFFFGLVLVILRLLNDFSSGLTYLSYNAFCYLIIGHLIRQYTNIHNGIHNILNKRVQSLRNSSHKFG